MKTIQVTKTNINECIDMILERIAGDGRSIQVEYFVLKPGNSTNVKYTIENVNIVFDVRKCKHNYDCTSINLNNLIVYLKPGYVIEMPRKHSKHITIIGDGCSWKYSSRGASKRVYTQSIHIIKDKPPIFDYAKEMQINNSIRMIEDGSRDIIIGMCEELYN